MVVHQGPGINTKALFLTKILQPVTKILTIFLMAEYLFSINPTAHNMMQGTGCVKSWLSGHGAMLSLLLPFVKLFWNQRSLWHTSLMAYVPYMAPLVSASLPQYHAVRFGLTHSDSFPILLTTKSKLVSVARGRSF